MQAGFNYRNIIQTTCVCPDFATAQSQFKPGEQWSYSTSGFVLLKEVIARASKMPFPEFMQKRIFDTLGMKSSSYVENMRDIIKNRALAYERDGSGRWKMAMLLDNDRSGGGGVLTTASDLLIGNDALTNNRLGKFVSEEMQRPTTLNNGRKIDYGRGLFLGIAAPKRSGTAEVPMDTKPG